MSVNTMVRWSVRHGVARAFLRRARKAGDPQARIFTDPAVRADPYPTYDLIRSTGPIVPGKFVYATASHAVVGSVLRDDTFVSSVPTMPGPIGRYLRRPHAIGPVDPPSLLVIDPPDHTRLRRMVSRVFTPRAMAHLRTRVGELADELLDEAPRDRPVDLVHTYASMLPVTVIAEILGVPVHLREQFVAWGNAAAPILDVGLSYREFRDATRVIGEVNEWMSGHFARLRENPGDDLLSQLVKRADDDEALTEREMMATALLLLAAGFETTVNLISNGLKLLVDHPEQLDELRADPTLWPNAVEEILRYDSPVQNTVRRATRTTEVAGVRVPAGAFLSILIGGANRDPAVFTDPGRFDIHRPNAREHLAFSSGIHYCLGASLARIEGEEALRRLVERYPDLTLAGAGQRRPTRILRGYSELPVLLG